MSLLDKFRKWLDADYQEEREIGARPRNKAEEFLVSIAREIEKEMREQMFTPPGGPTYIPRDYIVFLSTEDDAEWRGEKRRGLEQGLFHVLSEQAGQLVEEGQNLQTSSFTVELRVDGTLEKGKFRIQAVWDSETEKTVVRPRANRELESTRETEDEETMVRTRSLFSVAISRVGESEAKTVNFHQPLITVGRGSRKTKVDLPLQDDLEISRHHATIEYQDGQFKVTCEGQNPILIDGAELPEGGSTQVLPGQRIEICSYILQLGPSK